MCADTNDRARGVRAARRRRLVALSFALDRFETMLDCRLQQPIFEQPIRVNSAGHTFGDGRYLLAWPSFGHYESLCVLDLFHNSRM